MCDHFSRPGTWFASSLLALSMSWENLHFLWESRLCCDQVFSRDGKILNNSVIGLAPLNPNRQYWGMRIVKIRGNFIIFSKVVKFLVFMSRSSSMLHMFILLTWFRLNIAYCKYFVTNLYVTFNIFVEQFSMVFLRRL